METIEITDNTPQYITEYLKQLNIHECELKRITIKRISDTRIILHNDKDEPSVIHKNGMIEYWYNGKLHRLNKPAVYYSKNHYDYFINNKLIRSVLICKKSIKCYYGEAIEIRDNENNLFTY